MYIAVLLPLSVPQAYTYSVPTYLQKDIQLGVQVEVQLGKRKLYTGLVVGIVAQAPTEFEVKDILAVIDPSPIVNEKQLKFWQWIADYYCCTQGEVMNAALPSGLKLTSETKIVLRPEFDDDFTDLTEQEYLIAEALTIQNKLTVEEVRKIVDKKKVDRLIDSLISKRVIFVEEELEQKYKVKTVSCVRLAAAYQDDNAQLKTAFEQIGRAIKQTEALLGYVQLSKQRQHITKKELLETSKTEAAVITALVKKGIFEIYPLEISRLNTYEEAVLSSLPLSPQQTEALQQLAKSFETYNTVLLHGITGSGKTRVYIELIEEAVKRGEQVLYLLPEIALTAQIVERLRKVFGDDIAVYHSKFNNNERVEIWQTIIGGKPIVVGARSSIFLPFQRLGLIIVDEEHDNSFKQIDPAPRYSARDMAVLLGIMHGAKVLLGTATPSVETYQNVKAGRYGLVEMTERFGGVQLPQIVTVDLKDELRKKKLKGNFSETLLQLLREALARGEQAILFQNRRGYAPTLHCQTCGWVSQCINCDVSMTYHKFSNAMRCHYCGHEKKVPSSCPACGQHKLLHKGMGTEKIEDELQILMPDAKIARMDWDTVRTKNGHAELIHRFENKEIDILVGTQMVTKGLDFDNVSLVGVLSADTLLHFPDFRATERAFQLLTQVSGRAGRKQKQGLVILQTYETEHPVLKEVINNDFQGFLERELKERYDFQYPPFFRLIEITVSSEEIEKVKYGSEFLAKRLKEQLGERVLGPTEPYVARVRNQYLRQILIKLERQKNVIDEAKALLLQAELLLHQERGMSTVRVNINVDPY
jgi:primosomal protein N' (replication factor Y) (superfamily II helicase)